MEIENTGGQGLPTITDPVTGRTYPIIAGGSDAGAAVSDGGEGTVLGDGGEGAPAGEPAPTEGGQNTPEGDAGSSGQGFLEPYLNDVPEDQRAVVEPVLERYRQEQDARFNKRFEQLQEDARIPTTIYQSLLQDPVQTLNWIADRMQEERGLDIRSTLVDQWGNPVPQGEEGQPSQPEGEQGDKPLTQADIDRILEERENKRQQEQRQQQFEQQQIQKQQETVNNWIDDAAQKASLPLDDTNGEDPLRAVIIMQANQFHESGVARGQAAIDMAVESVAKRFGTVNQNGNQGAGSPQPRVADGGTPPPAKDIDVSDPAQRKARMEELFSSPAGS